MGQHSLLNKYATVKAPVRRQTGGDLGGDQMAPAGAPAPAGEEGGQDQFVAALQQIVETNDQEAALQLCAQLLSEMTGGGGQAAPEGGAAPAGGAPMARTGGEIKSSPKFSRQGVLL